MVLRPITNGFVCVKVLFFCVTMLILSDFAHADSNISANSPLSSNDISSNKSTSSYDGVSTKSDGQGESSPGENSIGQVESLENKTLSARNPSGLQEQVGNQSAENADSDASGRKSIIQEPSLLKAIVSLLFVLALILLLGYLYKRFAVGSGRLGSSPAIEIIARSTVNPKQTLCLVKLPSRLLLIGLSPNHMASLASIDDPDEIAQMMGLVEQESAHSISNSFGRLFQRASGEYTQHDIDQEDDDQNPKTQWQDPGNELASLVKKVKGLAKMPFRS